MKSLTIAVPLFALLASTLLALTSGCGGTTTGNPIVTLNYNPNALAFGFPFVPSASAAISSLKLCFKRLRFKKSGETTTSDKTLDPENEDFSIGEVSISQTSNTKLGTVPVSNGVYTRLEIDLEPGCGSGKSVQLTNDNGTYISTDTMSFQFTGTFTLSGLDRGMDLSIQAVLALLNTVSGASSTTVNNPNIKTYVEAASGAFKD